MAHATAKLEAYEDQLQTGKAGSAEAKVLQYLKKEGFATIWEIEQATGIARNTITARLNPLQQTGIVYKMGKQKPLGADRHYTTYAYVQNKENRPFFGKLFFLSMSENDLSRIMKNEGKIYSKDYRKQTALELLEVRQEIEHYQILVGLKTNNQ